MEYFHAKSWSIAWKKMLSVRGCISRVIIITIKNRTFPRWDNFASLFIIETLSIEDSWLKGWKMKFRKDRNVFEWRTSNELLSILLHFHFSSIYRKRGMKKLFERASRDLKARLRLMGSADFREHGYYWRIKLKRTIFNDGEDE